jgi:hypothetical protein
MALLTLLISFALDKCWISRAFPEVSGLISINPMPVFLDIPVDLSLTFGLLPVMAFFILFYFALQGSARGLSRAFGAVLAVPGYTLLGGFVYWLLQEQIPKHARNAIESFGINADLYTAVPGYERIHLRGSMVMLGCFLAGVHICVRKMRKQGAVGSVAVGSVAVGSVAVGSVMMEPVAVGSVVLGSAAIADHVQEPGAFAINSMEN